MEGEKRKATGRKEGFKVLKIDGKGVWVDGGEKTEGSKGIQEDKNMTHKKHG